MEPASGRHHGIMRKETLKRALGLLVVPMVMSLSSVVGATIDGGSNSELLGYAGHQQRYAIIAEPSVQVDCDAAGCPIYVVDLLEPTHRRLARIDWPGSDQEAPKNDLLLRYV